MERRPRTAEEKHKMPSAPKAMLANQMMLSKVLALAQGALADDYTPAGRKRRKMFPEWFAEVETLSELFLQSCAIGDGLQRQFVQMLNDAHIPIPAHSADDQALASLADEIRYRQWWRDNELQALASHMASRPW